MERSQETIYGSLHVETMCVVCSRKQNSTSARGLHQDNAVVPLLQEGLRLSNLLTPLLHGGDANKCDGILQGRIGGSHKPQGVSESMCACT
jgi:hypothetical protein